MTRSDLLVARIKAGTTGDKRGVTRAAEAIIAEERAKQHNVLAERLAAIVENGNNTHTAMPLLKPC